MELDFKKEEQMKDIIICVVEKQSLSRLVEVSDKDYELLRSEEVSGETEKEIEEMFEDLDFAKNTDRETDYGFYKTDGSPILPLEEDKEKKKLKDLLKAAIGELYESAEDWYREEIPGLIGSTKEELEKLEVI